MNLYGLLELPIVISYKILDIILWKLPKNSGNLPVKSKIVGYGYCIF